jgi:hypothetical protein
MSRTENGSAAAGLSSTELAGAEDHKCEADGNWLWKAPLALLCLIVSDVQDSACLALQES